MKKRETIVDHNIATSNRNFWETPDDEVYEQGLRSYMMTKVKVKGQGHRYACIHTKKEDHNYATSNI